MPDDKDHSCTGVNCIYCQIAADEKLASSKGSQFEQWEKLAFFDPLTGLSNIHVFMKELKYEVARANRYKRPLSIGILCIDNYQELKNDFGPLGCTLSLKHMGKLLQGALREVDIAARLQVEQFALILPETNLAGGNIVAERIREKLLKNPVKLNALNIDITCSIGISSFPKHGLDAESLLESCLKAQSAAANKGGNVVLAL